ncbi:MAG: hypothetical protein ACNA8W_24760 [Bradymonadaceae bacterium]
MTLKGSDQSHGDLAVIRPWFQRPAGCAGIALGGVAVFVLVCCLSPVSWLKGDTDIFGKYHFIQALEDEEDELEGMALVHARLFPRWTIEVGNRAPEQRRGLKSFETL